MWWVGIFISHLSHCRTQRWWILRTSIYDLRLRCTAHFASLKYYVSYCPSSRSMKWSPQLLPYSNLILCSHYLVVWDLTGDFTSECYFLGSTPYYSHTEYRCCLGWQLKLNLAKTVATSRLVVVVLQHTHTNTFAHYQSRLVFCLVEVLDRL